MIHFTKTTKILAVFMLAIMPLTSFAQITKKPATVLVGKFVQGSGVELSFFITKDARLSSFNIYRTKEGERNFQLIANTSSNVSSYIDSVIVSNASYSYYVRAVYKGTVTTAPSSNVVTVRVGEHKSPIEKPLPKEDIKIDPKPIDVPPVVKPPVIPPDTKNPPKDANTEINPRLKEKSDVKFLTGLWHVSSMVTPNNEKLKNTYRGSETGLTINLTINNNGTWSSKGYRAYQQPTPNDGGTWTSVYDEVNNVEVVTFKHKKNSAETVIRIHAVKEQLTMFAGLNPKPGIQTFISGRDNYTQQVIFTPGIGFFNAPHAPFR